MQKIVSICKDFRAIEGPNSTLRSTPLLNGKAWNITGDVAGGFLREMTFPPASAIRRPPPGGAKVIAARVLT